jgi:hypothetical protein
VGLFLATLKTPFASQLFALSPLYATHRRYIGKLYAKEIVLLNFPGISQNETLERLVEVLVRIEKQL